MRQWESAARRTGSGVGGGKAGLPWARAMRRPARSLCARQAAQRKSTTAASAARGMTARGERQICSDMPCCALQLAMRPLNVLSHLKWQYALHRAVHMCLSSHQLRDRRHRRELDFRSNCFPALARRPASAVAWPYDDHTPTHAIIQRLGQTILAKTT